MGIQKYLSLNIFVSLCTLQDFSLTQPSLDLTLLHSQPLPPVTLLWPTHSEDLKLSLTPPLDINMLDMVPDTPVLDTVLDTPVLDTVLDTPVLDTVLDIPVLDTVLDIHILDTVLDTVLDGTDSVLPTTEDSAGTDSAPMPPSLTQWPSTTPS